jgi:hypothetical protein
MYSSATMSNSASGLRAVALGDGDGFGEGEEAAGEGEEEAGEAVDFGLAGAEGPGLAEGVGDAFCNGFTGPVGFSGVLGVGLGVEEGKGAGIALERGRQTASAKMKERNLMAEAASSCGGNLRRRFARCQKFPHERSSFRPDTGFHL